MLGDRGDIKEMKKFIAYAAVFGKKSNFKMPRPFDMNVERVLYTDLDVFEPHVFYQVKKISLDHMSLNFTRKNRIAKILIPDEIFDNYEYSLYLDYKHPTEADFDHLVNCLEPDSDILVSKHKMRDCIYDEGQKCIEKGKGSESEILEQLYFYRTQGYPAHNGLFANYWIFRRHTKRLREQMHLWWRQVEEYSERDQISLPYVAWKHNMKISNPVRH